MTGRKRPYTATEIASVKCRCGGRGRFQWNCCANGNRWIAVCAACDIALNEMALAFFRVPDRVKLMARYRRKVKA